MFQNFSLVIFDLCAISSTSSSSQIFCKKFYQALAYNFNFFSSNVLLVFFMIYFKNPFCKLLCGNKTPFHAISWNLYVPTFTL